MPRTMYSANGSIAIKQPVFTKIETQNKSGFAFNSNRVGLMLSEVIFGYESDTLYLSAGDRVILRSDSGLQSWAKQVLSLDGEEFVLCPVSAIVGYERGEGTEE